MKVEITNAEVITVDPNKKYLFIIDNSKLTKNEMQMLSKGLKSRFGKNVFTLATRKGLDVQIVEIDK